MARGQHFGLLWDFCCCCCCCASLCEVRSYYDTDSENDFLSERMKMLPQLWFLDKLIYYASFLMFSCLNRKSQTLFFSRNLDHPWLQNSTFIVKKWPTCKNYIPKILISVPSSVMHILAKCLHNSEKDNLVFKDKFEVL